MSSADVGTMPLASVIVSMYNVENYIERCVESLLRQSCDDIEIILIDDGFPDGSECLADAMVARDERARVIHKENGSVSSARNCGINSAKGKWVLFVDGDDYVDEDYVSYLVGPAASSGCDIAMNMASRQGAGGAPNLRDKECVIDALRATEYLYMGKVFVAVWNKAYRREFLEENDVRFDETVWYGEGMLFNVLALQRVSGGYSRQPESLPPSVQPQQRDERFQSREQPLWYQVVGAPKGTLGAHERADRHGLALSSALLQLHHSMRAHPDRIGRGEPRRVSFLHQGSQAGCRPAVEGGPPSQTEDSRDHLCNQLNIGCSQVSPEGQATPKSRASAPQRKKRTRVALPQAAAVCVASLVCGMA